MGSTVQLLQTTVDSIPSWDGPTWVTSIDFNIKSLQKFIIVYFISIFDINKRIRRLSPYKVWDSQVMVA